MLERSKIEKVNVEILHYAEKVQVKDLVKEFKKRIKKSINSQKISKPNKNKKEGEENEKNSDEDKISAEEQPEIDIDIRFLNSGKKRKINFNIIILIDCQRINFQLIALFFKPLEKIANVSTIVLISLKNTYLLKFFHKLFPSNIKSCRNAWRKF